MATPRTADIERSASTARPSLARSPRSLERSKTIARREVLEAFAAARKHGFAMRDEQEAFHFLRGWLEISDEQVDEILGRPQQ